MSLISKLIDIANTPLSQLKNKFYFTDNVQEKVKAKSKEINGCVTTQHVTNRYSQLTTETADEGEYGYSTRQDIDFTEAEQCFNDPKVSQSLDRLIDDIFSEPLILESKDDSEISQTLLNYNEQLKKEIEGEVEDFLEDAVKTALFFGHYVGEIIPKWSESQEFTGKRVINYVHSIRLGLIEFALNQFERPEAVHSLVNFDSYYPLERFFILSLGGLWSNPYGDSLFRKIRPYWKAKLMVRDDMIITSNRYSQPIPNVKYTESELRDKAQEIANNLYAGVVLALPEGVTAGFIDAGLKGDNPHMVILDYLDNMIAIGITGYDLSDEKGSRASDQVKSDEKTRRVSRLRRKIAGAYNEQIIRRFTSHNFDVNLYPIANYPIATFYTRENVDIVAFSNTAQISLDNGVLDFDKRPNDLIFYRKKMGYPDLSKDEIDELMESSRLTNDIETPEHETLEDEQELNDSESEMKVNLFNYEFE